MSCSRNKVRGLGSTADSSKGAPAEKRASPAHSFKKRRSDGLMRVAVVSEPAAFCRWDGEQRCPPADRDTSTEQNSRWLRVGHPTGGAG